MTRGAAALALTLLAASPARSGVEAAHGFTRVQGEIAFTTAVLFGCLTNQERRTPIADLPEVYRTGLTAAPDDELKFGPERLPANRVWISSVLGSHLHVYERSPDRCEIVADQLPVEDTLRRTRDVTLKLDPPFATVDVRPGYNPVVYESVRTVGERTIRVRLEGAEPGLPGHWSRFSLLHAVITGEPAQSGDPPVSP